MNAELQSNLSQCVLLVDDHVETCEFLTALLRSRGMSVMAVCDSVQAKGLIDHGLRPSLVVTDQMMPELTGLELIGHLRTRSGTEQLPVVLLSALKLPSRGDPYTIVLRKPFEPEAFCELVEELIGIRLC